jgi:hypothetical protein
MTTAAIVFLLCWATLIRAARTPIARLLHLLMVEMPAAALNRLEPGHIALAIVVTMLIVVHLNAGDSDPIRMVALFAPDVTLWLASIEISAIVEAVVALAAAAAALRRVGIAATLTRIFVSLPRHPKNKVNRARNGPRLNRKVPLNDDEDGVKFALAS